MNDLLVGYMIICGVLAQLYVTYRFIKDWKNESVETFELFLYLIGGGLAGGALSPLLIPFIIISPFWFLIKKLRKFNN